MSWTGPPSSATEMRRWVCTVRAPLTYSLLCVVCVCVCVQDEGVKQYESFVDVKNCSVSALSGKKR